jgi:hypothetical protein
VAKELGVPFVDQAMIAAVAQRLEAPIDVVASLDEVRRSWCSDTPPRARA